jgi:opacity protein-like surface antigen
VAQRCASLVLSLVANMKIANVHWSVVLLAVAGPFVIATAAAQQQTGRRGDIEYYGMAVYTSGSGGNVKSIADVHYDLDHLWMWGGGGAYFFTDRLSVLMDLTFGSSNLRLSDTRALSGPSFTQGADFFNGRVNLEFTPFTTAISPVATAGIGFNNVVTAVPGASPQTYCTPGVFYWWCGVGVPTYNETAFSYNVGIGARLDLTPVIFLKLMYNSTWAEYGGLSTRRTDQVSLQIGGRFHSVY